MFCCWIAFCTRLDTMMSKLLFVRQKGGFTSQRCVKSKNANHIFNHCVLDKWWLIDDAPLFSISFPWKMNVLESRRKGTVYETNHNMYQFSRQKFNIQFGNSISNNVNSMLWNETFVIDFQTLWVGLPLLCEIWMHMTYEWCILFQIEFPYALSPTDALLRIFALRRWLYLTNTWM